MTPEQRRFYEGGPRVMGGRSSGRRYATEMFIIATAANEEEAKLALEDLRTHGIALLSDEGKRVEPPRRNGARFACVKFDEEPRRVADCLDCDGAGCEKCGGTGRRLVS
jgi:hypothetical protein